MLGKSKYRDALEVFADLRLVFMNALFYNTDGSQISKDAATLKVGFIKECSDSRQPRHAG